MYFFLNGMIEFHLVGDGDACRQQNYEKYLLKYVCGHSIGSGLSECEPYLKRLI